MRVLPLSALLLPSVHSLTLPRSTQDCISFAQTAPAIQNVTLLNSTLISANNLNLSGTLNSPSFCRVLGQVAYGSNDTLNFQLWLPDPASYNGRFMAVGNSPLLCLAKVAVLTEIGNGGMAGTIDTPRLLTQFNSGFAVAGYFPPPSPLLFPQNFLIPPQRRCRPSSLSKQQRRRRPKHLYPLPPRSRSSKGMDPQRHRPLHFPLQNPNRFLLQPTSKLQLL